MDAPTVLLWVTTTTGIDSDISAKIWFTSLRKNMLSKEDSGSSISNRSKFWASLISCRSRNSERSPPETSNPSLFNTLYLIFANSLYSSDRARFSMESNGLVALLINMIWIGNLAPPREKSVPPTPKMLPRPTVSLNSRATKNLLGGRLDLAGWPSDNLTILGGESDGQRRSNGCGLRSGPPWGLCRRVALPAGWN
jgi:hypothetical protein